MLIQITVPPQEYIKHECVLTLKVYLAEQVGKVIRYYFQPPIPNISDESWGDGDRIINYAILSISPDDPPHLWFDSVNGGDWVITVSACKEVREFPSLWPYQDPIS